MMGVKKIIEEESKDFVKMLNEIGLDMDKFWDYIDKVYVEDKREAHRWVVYFEALLKYCRKELLITLQDWEKSKLRKVRLERLKQLILERVPSLIMKRYEEMGIFEYD